MALTPPTTTAPSNAATIQPTTGPADRTDAWDGKKGRPEQQSPETSPKCAGLAPVLHPVAGIVVTNHVFIGVGTRRRI
jgi:hypothetical protein